MTIALPWPAIDVVLLDMDGTLLDLYFDNQFWREHVPLRYAEREGVSVEAAKLALYPRFQGVEGTLPWYCLDHWSRELALDIPALKEELAHLIAVLPGVPEFLASLKTAGKRVYLVTNAHHKALALKLSRTGLADHFIGMVSAHSIGVPKEHADFWQRLRSRIHYDDAHTLLIDDSLPVLRSARAHGIAHLVAICRPDSRAPARCIEEFTAVEGIHALPLPSTDRTATNLRGG